MHHVPGAIQALNACYAAMAMLLLLLMPATLYAAGRLHNHYGTLAAHLPLQDCAEIDQIDLIDAAAWPAAAAAAVAGRGPLAAAASAAASAAPGEGLQQLLAEAEAAYTAQAAAAALLRGEQREPQPQPVRPPSCSGLL